MQAQYLFRTRARGGVKAVPNGAGLWARLLLAASVFSISRLQQQQQQQSKALAICRRQHPQRLTRYGAHAVLYYGRLGTGRGRAPDGSLWRRSRGRAHTLLLKLPPSVRTAMPVRCGRTRCRCDRTPTTTWDAAAACYTMRRRHDIVRLIACSPRFRPSVWCRRVADAVLSSVADVWSVAGAGDSADWLTESLRERCNVRLSTSYCTTYMQRVCIGIARYNVYTLFVSLSVRHTGGGWTIIFQWMPDGSPGTLGV